MLQKKRAHLVQPVAGGKVFVTPAALRATWPDLYERLVAAPVRSGADRGAGRPAFTWCGRRGTAHQRCAGAPSRRAPAGGQAPLDAADFAARNGSCAGDTCWPRSQKDADSSTNPTLTGPGGPLRCFPTMISASPAGQLSSS